MNQQHARLGGNRDALLKNKSAAFLEFNVRLRRSGATADRKNRAHPPHNRHPTVRVCTTTVVHTRELIGGAPSIANIDVGTVFTFGDFILETASTGISVCDVPESANFSAARMVLIRVTLISRAQDVQHLPRLMFIAIDRQIASDNWPSGVSLTSHFIVARGEKSDRKDVKRHRH